MKLRVASLNMSYGAVQEGRWPGLARLVRKVRPDILALQECRGWVMDGYRMARQAAEVLGMEIRVGRCPQGRSPEETGETAIAWRPELELAAFEDHVFDVSRGYSLGVFRVPGDDLVAVASVHASPYSREQALIDSLPMAARVRRWGGIGIAAGDFNQPGLHQPPPDWSQLMPYNRANRGIPADPLEPWNGPWGVDLTLALRMRAAEMIDVAAHLALVRQDKRLLAATGRGQMRVDHIYVVRALAPGILDYGLVDTQGLSDHALIWTDLDLEKVDRSQLQEYR